MMHVVYVDNLVLVRENLEEVNYRLEECREALESKGSTISRSKFVYIEFNFYLGDRAQRVNRKGM